MGGRGFTQLTARDRVLISKLKEDKLSVSETARRIGKNKSTVSRELRRNQTNATPQEVCFWFRVQRLWTEEEFNKYLQTQPRAERQVKTHWTHAEAQAHCAYRRWVANQKRRRKLPETRKWVVEKLRQGWSPQQIAGGRKSRESNTFTRFASRQEAGRQAVPSAEAIREAQAAPGRPTVDNGKEFYHHPGSPSRLNEIEKLLNHRPRKCLGYFTPNVGSQNLWTPEG